MRMLREWTARLWGTVRQRRTDADLEEELRVHLALAAERAQRRGVEGDASRTARLAAGGAAQAMNALRDQRGLPWLEDTARDTRHALRAMRRTPIFATVVVLTMALGIGANTAIFSVVNAVLLRPLAYPHPAELMYLTTRLPDFPQFPASVAEYLEFRRFNQSFVDVGAFRIDEANLVASDRPLRVRAAIVDAHLLNTLGVQAADGRLFSDDDTGVVSPPPVALISYGLWQSVFGGRPIAGVSVEVDGRRRQIVGVTAPGADIMDVHAEIWLPLGFTEDERQARNNHDLSIIGRLKRGITLASAQAELNTLNETWRVRTGITPGLDHAGHVFLPPGNGSSGHLLQMTPLADQILGRAARSIWVLQAAASFVLLIACANVANLLLARAEARQREFAVLTALGAGRGRLVRKATTESVILCLTGGVLGMLIARIGVEALLRAYPTSLPRIGEVSVDTRVMLASTTIALLCGLIFGLAPALQARTDATSETLKSAPRGSTATTRLRMRGALVMAETAFAVIVVVGTGLVLRTVHNLTVVDGGFDRSRLVTFSITLPEASSNLLGRARAYQRLLDDLRAVPGVRAATAMTGLPLDSPLSAYQTEISNNTATSGPSIPAINYYQRVMSNYFDTMGIPIVQGRAFESTDTVSGGRVVVVNEALANMYWKGLNPIGQQLRPCCGGDATSWFTVIGVAKNVKEGGVDQPSGTEAYILLDQVATDSPTTWLAFSPTTMNVVVKTTLPLTSVAPTIAQVVRGVDPRVPVTRLREMDAVFSESIRSPRLLALLLTVFATLALLLAAIGTYGVLASSVAERRREIGIRLALGASRAHLLVAMMMRGLTLAGIGMVVGLVIAVGLNRMLKSVLFGVDPTDGVTLAIAIPSVVAIAALASWLPAWRASRLDPNVILRTD